ncbi:MAG: hypothetical protein LBM20_08100 [Rikenellaceae bacterium]|jgi:hypothetical protein|nr:hypothetical protein [Rikenellaceae bacterium]
MILIAASEFRKNQKKYFQLALTEKIGVKSGDVVFEITPSRELFVNPSPSGDPFWDDPRNVEELNRRIDELKSGKSTLTPYSAEEFKRRFGL